MAFVGVLVAARSQADLDRIRSTIRSAFAQGLLADTQVPASWVDRGGHPFTECVSLNVALDSQDDILKSALLPMRAFRMVSPCCELHWLADGDRVADTAIDDSRYWHGCRIYDWRMLASLSLRQVRCANALAVAVAAAVFFAGLRAALGTMPAAVLFVVFLALTDTWRICMDGLEESSRMVRLPLVPSVEMLGTSLVSVGVVFVAAIAFLIFVHARDRRSAFQGRRFCSLVSPTMISFAWFEPLSNHTQLHPHFVYRSASGAIAIWLAPMVMANEAPISLRWVAA